MRMTAAIRGRWHLSCEIGLLSIICLVVFSQYLQPLTKEKAVAALVEKFPRLEGKSIVERDGRFEIADISFDIHAKTWTEAERHKGHPFHNGHFERDFFGGWQVDVWWCSNCAM